MVKRSCGACGAAIMVKHLCCSGFAGCKPWWGSPHCSAHLHPGIHPASNIHHYCHHLLQHLCHSLRCTQLIHLVPTASFLQLFPSVIASSPCPFTSIPSHFFPFVRHLRSFFSSFSTLHRFFTIFPECNTLFPVCNSFFPCYHTSSPCAYSTSPPHNTMQHSNPALPLTRRCMELLTAALATARYNCNNSG